MSQNIRFAQKSFIFASKSATIVEKGMHTAIFRSFLTHLGLAPHIFVVIFTLCIPKAATQRSCMQPSFPESRIRRRDFHPSFPEHRHTALLFAALISREPHICVVIFTLHFPSNAIERSCLQRSFPESRIYAS